MSDLTKRLTILHGQASRESGRSAVTAIGPSLLAQTLKEAADEIDRLTRELAEARDKALEEAANKLDGEAEECVDQFIAEIIRENAAAIRALKEKP